MHQAQDIYEEANRYLLLKLNYDAQKYQLIQLRLKPLQILLVIQVDWMQNTISQNLMIYS